MGLRNEGPFLKNAGWRFTMARITCSIVEKRLFAALMKSSALRLLF
jgi:hypothetical protein